MEMSVRFPNLDLAFGYIPKSFRVFGFEITIYGILVALGMLLAVAFVVLEAKRRNQNQNLYLGMLILTIPAGVAGARGLYVLCNWNLYEGDFARILDIRSGGLMWYGGILAGVMIAAVYCKIAGISFGQAADIIGMGMLIGQIVGRWGDFFNRGSFGRYTDSMFAMQLPVSAVSAGEITAQMREHLQTIDGVAYIQVHPAFLYESVWCLLLLIILLAYNRRRSFHGEIFMRYLAGYGLGRAVIEWLRTDQVAIPGTRISVSLVVSVVLFLVFGITAAVKRTMWKKRVAVRKRRREKIYDEEEKAEAESARAEAEAEARAKAAKEEAEEFMRVREEAERLQEQQHVAEQQFAGEQQEAEQQNDGEQQESEDQSGELVEDIPEEVSGVQNPEASEPAESEAPIQKGSGREYWIEP